MNGFGLALLTTTCFPECVDSVEKRSDYAQYDKESTNLQISSLFVFVSSLAQLLGLFFGSTFADLWGYNIAFIIAGTIMICYAIFYAAMCGTGAKP